MFYVMLPFDFLFIFNTGYNFRTLSFNKQHIIISVRCDIAEQKGNVIGFPVFKRIILPKLVSFWILVLPSLEYNRNNSKKIGNHDPYAQEILLTGNKQELLSSY